MSQRRLFIQWDSTNDCNLRCKHCYHNREGEEHATHKQEESKLMNYNEVQGMINDLADTAKRWNFKPQFNISGGEPLMREDLMQILEYTKSLNVETRLLTNGTLLNEKNCNDIYARGVERLQVSLDGNKEMHNKIRKKSFAYDFALKGIENASKQGILVNVSMTVMQSNKDCLEDVIKNSQVAGAKIVGFQSYVPNIALGLNDPEYVNAKETYEIYEKIRELRMKYNGQIKVLENEVLWQMMQWDTKLKQEARATGKFLSGCGAGFSGVSVLSDGTVYPCRRLPIPIGKISEGLSNIIIENEVLKNLRSFKFLCNNGCCEDVPYCRGCRAVAYAVTGDYMAKDPMCFKMMVKPEERE